MSLSTEVRDQTDLLEAASALTPEQVRSVNFSHMLPAGTTVVVNFEITRGQTAERLLTIEEPLDVSQIRLMDDSGPISFMLGSDELRRLGRSGGNGWRRGSKYPLLDAQLRAQHAFLERYGDTLGLTGNERSKIGATTLRLDVRRAQPVATRPR